ncbi:unnamed protein product [Fraxinus pennsylvanica]|uniref:Uncharacterized protein n=1 Tax=Fraxinus pennsylvanica TaxID=56036 RepID=A0AAD1YN73_9LAMI|nr:unnamed protein product [Fraxinus pennsylvanica]
MSIRPRGGPIAPSLAVPFKDTASFNFGDAVFCSGYMLSGNRIIIAQEILASCTLHENPDECITYGQGLEMGCACLRRIIDLGCFWISLLKRSDCVYSTNNFLDYLKEASISWAIIILFPESMYPEQNTASPKLKLAVSLNGTAKEGAIGPPLGLIDIGESEGGYLFRVALPGAKSSNIVMDVLIPLVDVFKVVFENLEPVQFLFNAFIVLTVFLNP